MDQSKIKIAFSSSFRIISSLQEMGICHTLAQQKGQRRTVLFVSMISILFYLKSTTSTPGYLFLSKINWLSASGELVFMLLTV